MGNSMYDKNEIEDSLEFCRQIKEYEDISATDKGTANESQDKSLSVMAEEMETQSHSWDHILQEQDPVSVDFDAVKPFIAPPEPETSAKAMGGLLEKEEEAKRIQEKQREQARQKALARAEAAKKANEEAVRLKAEQERKATEEAARLKAEQEKKAAEEAARLKAEQERKAAEEAARLKAEQERKAAEEAARLKAEQERKAAEEAALEQHRHELELQNKLQQQRAETEALARKQQQLEEAEAQRIAQAQREAVARTRAKLQQQRQQELAKQQETLRQQELAKQESIRRQELERQREVQARQEAMRLREQEKQARQLAAKQEQLQREEEARAHTAAMEQARQQMEVQSRRQADQAEQLRLRIEAQKQREAESAARETFIQSNSSLAAERQRAAMEAEAEARILQERAEELKRQAEVAALEARIHQLEQESARARGEYAASYGTQSATQQPVYTDPLAQSRIQQPVYIDPHTQNRTQQPVYTDSRTQNTAQQMYTGTSASGYPGQTQTAAGSVSKQKLSEKQINEIFAQGLEKERKESRAKRNALIQRQADKENARIRQERAENGVKPPVERVLDMVKAGKDKAVDILSDVFHTVKEKSEDPELQEQKTKASRLFGNLLVIAICVFIAYCVASVVTSFVANPTKVEGESMESTLTNGDTVLIQKMSYYFGDPKRYDVVVFPVPYYNSDTKYIKRVIGLPGETVQIIEGKVYINGKELKDDTYGKDKVIDDPGDAVEPITLADDEYFVLGDNRNMSTDSRSSYVGLIRRKSIIGKACARIFPLSKMGGIAG